MENARELDLLRQVLLPATIFLVMTAIGLELRRNDFLAVVARPLRLTFALALQAAVFPLVGAGVIATTEVSTPVLMGIVILAACPPGGFSNIATLIARGDLALAVTLTFLSNILALLTLPIFLAYGLALVGAAGIGVPAVPASQIAGQVFALVAIPVAVGMVVRFSFPAFTAGRVVTWQRLSQLSMFAVIAALFYREWPLLAQNAGEALPISVVLYLGTVALSYALLTALGSPRPEAVTLTFVAAMRNLGVAALVAITSFGRLDWALLPAVHLVVSTSMGTVMALLFRWRAAPRSDTALDPRGEGA